MAWTHFNPVRILAGSGTLAALPSLVADHASVLLVTSAGFTRRGVTARVLDSIRSSAACRVWVHDEILPNPQLDDLDALAERLVPERFGAIIALGGGSVLDAGKVLSVVLPSRGSQVLHRSLRLQQGQSWTAHLPVVAVPTTSGTGSEVTPFATVWDAETRRKFSVAGDSVFPRHAILDADLCVSLGTDETLYTALDAISHSLESLWNRHRTPVSIALALQALALSEQALPVVLARPDDIEHRARLQQASLFAGLAISQNRTALAHSISYPLTIHHGMPHGLACSFTLKVLLEDNMRDLAASTGAGPLLQRVRSLLESIDFASHLSRYASVEQIMALRSEMRTPGRADSFAFDADLEEVLSRSVAEAPRT